MDQILFTIFRWFWGGGDDEKKPSEKAPLISPPTSGSYSNSSSSRPAFQQNPVTPPLASGSCRYYSWQTNVKAHPPLSDSKTRSCGLSRTSGSSNVHPQLHTHQRPSSSSCIKSSNPPKLEHPHQPPTTISGGLSSPRGTCHVQSKIQTHHLLLSTHSTVSAAAPHQPKLESCCSSGSVSCSNSSINVAYPSFPPSLDSRGNSSQVSSRLPPFNRIEQKEEPPRGVVVGKRWTDQCSSSEEDEEGKRSIRAFVEKRWIKHYSNEHEMLLVGEGDFSFSASLAVAFGSATNITATSLDSIEYLTTNYKRALSSINTLRILGGTVMHGVDATKMANIFPFKWMCFDLVVYNFPHAGFFPNEPREAQICRHQSLVKMFLENAKKMIHGNGEIHITHKSNGFFYDWNLKSLASSVGLRLVEEVPFDFRDYPGYPTKYGFGGDNNFNCNPSKTYKFGHPTTIYEMIQWE